MSINNNSTDALTVNTDEAQKFLDWLRPSDQRSITLIPVERKPGGGTVTRGHTPGNELKFLPWALENAHNVYFCVARVSQFGKKAKKEDVVALNHAWVDVDLPAVKDPTEFQTKLQEIQDSFTVNRPASIPEPACVVFSGGGCQAFWALDREVKGDEIEAINRGIMMELNTVLTPLGMKADNCWNQDRVMRLPGSINLPDEKKQAKGRTPQLARIISLKPELVVDPSTLPHKESIDTNTKAGKEKVKKDLGLDEKARVRVADVETLECPEWVKRVITNGFDPMHQIEEGKDVSRSAWLFRVICELIRSGVKDATIFGVITDPKFKISESVLERSDWEAYAEKNITNGHSRAKRENRQERVVDNTDAVQMEAPVGIPSANMSDRPLLNDGSPDTLAKYIKPKLNAKELVSSYERLYRVTEASDGLWLEMGEREDVYPAMAPLSAALYLRPVMTEDGPIMAPTGLVKLNDSLVRDVTKSLNTQHVNPRFFDSAPIGVAFKNGFIGPDGKLEKLTSNHRQRNRLQWDYMPDVDLAKDAPRFAQALQEWFQPKHLQADATREEVEAAVQDSIDRGMCLGEFAGLALMGAFGPSSMGRANIHTAVMNIGEGANGKSVFLELLGEMVPAEYKANVPPQDMGHEYNRDALSGKRVNICPEIPEKEVINTGHLKALISCDPGMTARRPYYPPYAFQPIAGHIFSANTLPRFSDSSGGFLRRWILIHWPNVIPEGQRDKQLCKKLLGQEGAAIASWFIQQGIRAFHKGALTCPPSSDTMKGAWLGDSDQVVEFVQEKLKAYSNDPLVRPKQKDWTDVSTVYEQYEMWAKDSGHKFPLAKRTFIGRLNRAVGNTMTKQGGANRIPFEIVAPKSKNSWENREF